MENLTADRLKEIARYITHNYLTQLDQTKQAPDIEALIVEEARKYGITKPEALKELTKMTNRDINDHLYRILKNKFYTFKLADPDSVVRKITQQNIKSAEKDYDMEALVEVLDGLLQEDEEPDLIGGIIKAAEHEEYNEEKPFEYSFDYEKNGDVVELYKLAELYYDATNEIRGAIADGIPMEHVVKSIMDIIPQMKNELIKVAYDEALHHGGFNKEAEIPDHLDYNEDDPLYQSLKKLASGLTGAANKAIIAPFKAGGKLLWEGAKHSPLDLFFIATARKLPKVSVTTFKGLSGSKLME